MITPALRGQSGSLFDDQVGHFSVDKHIEWQYTPEHGSWLNIAECELSVLAAQCLDQRIPDKETLISEATAWNERRNKACAKVVWQFTTADARIKLRRLYPVVKEQNLT